jgi:Protein-tyrosine-phosphatase
VRNALRLGRVECRRLCFCLCGKQFQKPIAEAYFNKYAREGWIAVSAGIKPAERVHPNAVRLMLEEGIDINHKKPRMITRELQEKADIAVIVCSGALCPVVYTRHVEEWNMPDPAKMPLEEARRVRDAIKAKVLDLIERLKTQGKNRLSPTFF